MPSFATVVGYLLGILTVLVITGIIRAPLKWLFSLLLNSIVGCCVIYIVNILCKPAGFFIGINPVTAIFMGILGIPGVIGLVVLRLIMN